MGFLKSKGFDAINESGVVIVNLPSGKNKEYYEEKESEIKGLLDSIGYKASRGIHTV